MNLLTEPWIPVRPPTGGQPTVITLQELLCSPKQWTLCLPRDDMELAALQLLICLVQVIWLPEDDQALRLRLKEPLNEQEFVQSITSWNNTFCLDHPDKPFMQVRGVKAKEATGMDKLLAGLTGATNCAFINEPGQGAALCGGCASIALFNQANNAPSFGGGFKSGLRGGSPVTTLVQAVDSSIADLRITLWLNVLTRPRLQTLLGEDLQLRQPPTWQQPIESGANIPAGGIGLVRGLFWQPDHIELCPPIGEGQCSCCGQQATQRYAGFLKAKFNFTVTGVWPHPHSPRLMQIKKGVMEEKFLAFTTPAPSWTQISRVLVLRAPAETNKNSAGHRPAAVLAQNQELFAQLPLQLLMGGYRNNQASILERRHEVMIFNQGWQAHTDMIDEIVRAGLEHKSVLRKALFIFVEGLKQNNIKGAGVPVHEVAEREYFRQSDLLIPGILASINSDRQQNIERLNKLVRDLQRLCIHLFEQATAPYSHHPKLSIALAKARQNLFIHLAELKQPQGELYAV